MDHPRISQAPEIMGGKPCITGTRIPVAHILGYFGAFSSEVGTGSREENARKQEASAS